MVYLSREAMAETALELRAILEAAERAVSRRRFCLSGAAPASSRRAAGAADSVPGIPISPTRSTTSASSASTSENPPRPKRVIAERMESPARHCQPTIRSSRPAVRISKTSARRWASRSSRQELCRRALEPFASESGAAEAQRLRAPGRTSRSGNSALQHQPAAALRPSRRAIAEAP